MEHIELDPTKNYLNEEPFFIADKDGNAHILRPADFDPLKETN
ncbi:hypothetical protein [Arthrobacter sp. U41]|nr:hypothetical protein [Arthrobacter sp. U41]